VEEGKVASFLLATTSIVRLRSSIMKKKMLFEVRIGGLKSLSHYVDAYDQKIYHRLFL